MLFKKWESSYIDKQGDYIKLIDQDLKFQISDSSLFTNSLLIVRIIFLGISTIPKNYLIGKNLIYLVAAHVKYY